MASGVGGVVDLRGDVRGFFHICCIGSYREVTWEIVHALLESRLYDRSAMIEVGVLGSPADQQVIDEMLAPFERFRIAYRSDDVTDYEYPTLALLQDACRTFDGRVYYLHTKGVSYSPTNQYSRYWRRLMLDTIVTGYARCLAELTTFDTVGANWSGDHYSGNFWWARSSHIRRLPDIRELQHNPRTIGSEERLDGQPATGRGVGPVWNLRLQCEHWLNMEPSRVGVVGPRRRLHLYRELVWTVQSAYLVDRLRNATGAQRVAELSDQDSVPPAGSWDLILIDKRDDPVGLVDLIERCVPTLSPDGAVVVLHSNPPSAWHQRPTAEFTPGSDWTGQVWRAVVAFRIRNPACQVVTVDTDWGVTVIRPGRRPLHQLDPTVTADPNWAGFATRRQQLLNLVDVAWFRRYLRAEPYIVGVARPATGTELINILVGAAGLDSYLRFGAGAGEDYSAIIAPVRHRRGEDEVGPALGAYDLVTTDGAHLHTAMEQLSDRGWILVSGRAPVDVLRAHPEYGSWTMELDKAYTLIHRKTAHLPGASDDLRMIFCQDGGDTAHVGPVKLATAHYAGNRALLLAAVELDPDDLRSVLHLADSYFTAGDVAAARRWYDRALELRDWWWSGLDEPIYIAMMRIAEAMAAMGEPWPEVRDAYLRAWEFQPDRVAPLHAIATHYREDQRYQLGYLYAKAGADIAPAPEADTRARRAFSWMIRDELAVCASWTDRQAEAFTLWRDLLRRAELPDVDRARIAANRDTCVPAMLEAASSYPEGVVRSLQSAPGGSGVTVSLIVGPLRRPAEHTLNSFLHCCLDVARAERVLAIDAGLPPADRVLLQQRYPFLEFTPPGSILPSDIRDRIDTPLWLHLGQDWRFFAPDTLLTRLAAVLAADSGVFRVGVNLNDATELTGVSPAESTVRRASGVGRYVIAGPSAVPAVGPVMYDTARLDRTAGVGIGDTATLDEVLCVRRQLITIIGRGNSGTRAIARTLMNSGVFMGAPIKEDSADLVPAENMYEACRIISRYIPWRGGLEWDFGPVQTMPIPAEFTVLIERYLDSVLSSPESPAGWKLPETTLCYPWIRRLFPDIRYIFWVRNPRDCIIRHHFTDDLADFGIEYPHTDDIYLRRAISWKYQDDLVAATPRPRHWATVRLEDFVRHQERELDTLQTYLGVDLVPIPVRADAVDRHLQVPGVPFPEFLKPAMRRLGYLNGPG